MNERERLLEILNVPIYPHENVDPLEAVADYMIDNGVVLPVFCKECQYSTLPGRLIQRYGLPGTLTCKNPDSPCHCRNIIGTDYCPYGKRKENG